MIDENNIADFMKVFREYEEKAQTTKEHISFFERKNPVRHNYGEYLLEGQLFEVARLCRENSRPGIHFEAVVRDCFCITYTDAAGEHIVSNGINMGRPENIVGRAKLFILERVAAAGISFIDTKHVDAP